MFNPTLVEKALSKVDNQGTLKYACKVARFDPRILEIFSRELRSERGFIPESDNHDWHFPVVQYPNGEPEPNAPCHVAFIREDRKDGNGKRNVVRIYKVNAKPDAEAPLYRVAAALVRNANKAKVLLDTCRFAIAGNAENADAGTSKKFPEGGKFADKSDYAFVAIANSDEPVKAIAQFDAGDKQTEILF